MKLNSYNELLKLSNVSDVYVRTKPLILGDDEINPLRVTKQHVSKVKPEKDGDFDFKTINICSDNSVYFLVETPTSIEFNDNNNVHYFEANSMILISNSNGKDTLKWTFEKVEDLINFDSDFERLSYSDYKSELDHVNEFKKFKCTMLKDNLDNKYNKDMMDLKEKSSISFKLNINKNN